MSQRLMHRTAQRFVSPCGCAFVDNGLFRQGLPASVRQCKLLQRERAARNPDVAVFDYLKEEVGYRLSDRILDIKRELKVGLDLGCGRGYVAKNITDVELRHLYMSDFSPAMLEAAQTPENIGFTKILIDEEQKFPLESKLFDLVISNLNLHWVNNLPQCLKEIRRVLKEDGAFLASMFGGDTLFELRSSLVLAELEREGGFSPHVSPFTEIRDIGGLLNQCGFTMLTIDTDEITVGYPSLFELMWDLQGMAENNAGVSRKPHLHRDTLLAASAIYQEMYGKEEGIPATFQIIYMIGWKPDPKQVASQAERGSGQVSLKDLHKLDNIIQESGMEGRIKFVKDMIEDNDKNKKN
ncbi:arginine-hydroxylase NDUFAF5, mitochondrial-like isoform X2 [Homarus americanus]|uniref:arginine-hydroxylase NDUFAF5, mitochondrial-like isoform X2 n=1 Tax=Homarus americanus TaxID=6706 RepID=UPI001C449084|nr:arginine-hydroxylase NDUFAF5, mitochondrial-like isoform X2 [Homarus americanus]